MTKTFFSMFSKDSLFSTENTFSKRKILMFITSVLLLFFNLVNIAQASTQTTMSLLDNRFRVDPTIKQINFMIYREKNSIPVVLVRPDGGKYYAQRSPENVHWHQESMMDIISIDNPMPGPWQAIGKVSPNNKIVIITDLVLHAESLPSRLYQGETIKFTAKLTSEGKPLLLRDFLDRIKLKVNFTKYVENEESLIQEARPIAQEIGSFIDDGKELDEKPGDGIFTVRLPISVEPGKYRVRITSENGVFLRTIEQVVLVYPNPIDIEFVQSRNDANHKVVVTGEKGVIEPGSLMIHLTHHAADKFISYVESQVDRHDLTANLTLENRREPGAYSWEGRVFAEDMILKRPLVFELPTYTYSVTEGFDLEESERIRAEAEAIHRKKMEEQRILDQRREDKNQMLIIIVVCNVVILLLVVGIWFVLRKLKAKKAVPPKNDQANLSQQK